MKVATLAVLALIAGGVTACGGAGTSSSTSQTAAKVADPATVNIGYLTNLTHAPALIGVAKGFFQSHLPSGTTLQATTFSAGPAESEALLGGALDAAFVGPSPAISAFTKTKGGVVIIAGAAYGGAGLVVSQSIAAGNFPQDLKGQTLASPQLGNTQDVALRTWLAQQGLTTNVNGGGAVNIDATSGNSVDLQRFEAGQIVGGWEPEPYESQYVISGHGKLVVDEASLWPAGRFPTTELVVTKTLLSQHPDIVTDLLKGLLESLSWIEGNPSSAPAAANASLAAISGSQPLSSAVLTLAWSHLSFTDDPLASALQTDANHAKQLGLIKSSNLKGIVDAQPVNAVLRSTGRATVSDAGLG
ncbi:MAG TPA: ABC transporter substrate-binding protein [Chloroflexota bacterium]